MNSEFYSMPYKRRIVLAVIVSQIPNNILFILSVKTNIPGGLSVCFKSAVVNSVFFVRGQFTTLIRDGMNEVKDFVCIFYSAFNKCEI